MKWRLYGYAGDELEGLPTITAEAAIDAVWGSLPAEAMTTDGNRTPSEARRPEGTRLSVRGSLETSVAPPILFAWRRQPLM